jgi:L-lactate dehydrogenase complex protein LldE
VARHGSGARVLFSTCLVETLRPDLVDATLRVLRDHGLEAEPARGATCCGQPAWNIGLRDDARRVARTSLAALGGAGQVVVPSGSCATMMREFWPALFEGTREAADASSVSERVVELSSLLADQSPAGQAPRANRTVAYHDSCHMLRELQVHDQPRGVLAAAGTAVREIDGAELCCGFGGTFSVKLPEISVAMADEKLDAVVAAGCDELVGCDLSCLMHLEGRARQRGLDVRTSHLVEHLERAST